jgi:hypothetical protein
MSADDESAFPQFSVGFLDERGVRWTPSIPLSTGRFGVQVPGGAPKRTGHSRPVLGVDRAHPGQARDVIDAASPARDRPFSRA